MHPDGPCSGHKPKCLPRNPVGLSTLAIDHLLCEKQSLVMEIRHNGKESCCHTISSLLRHSELTQELSSRQRAWICPPHNPMPTTDPPPAHQTPALLKKVFRSSLPQHRDFLTGAQACPEASPDPKTLQSSFE